MSSDLAFTRGFVEFIWDEPATSIAVAAGIQPQVASLSLDAQSTGCANILKMEGFINEIEKCGILNTQLDLAKITLRLARHERPKTMDESLMLWHKAQATAVVEKSVVDMTSTLIAMMAFKVYCDSLFGEEEVEKRRRTRRWFLTLLRKQNTQDHK
jgi:hypothetical protein